ncbi:glycosyltransferase [Paraglaciecola sp.]|uniref:glycosyltransferase family 2 protein n=1 Tax=Paraglaciecola sp. TaxID=1920173 RepID=UPI0032677EEC
MNLVGIIPTLNRPDDIRLLFDSIAKLTQPTDVNFTIVVIDNSPDANVQALVNSIECPFKLTYINQKKKGLSNARNAAIEAISDNTDYVCTIDDDLVLPESFIVDLQGSIQKYPHAGMIGGRVELYNQQDLPITIKTSKNHDKYAGGLKLFGFVHGCCMLFSKDVMDKTGQFDTNLGAGSLCGSAEDTDYYYRIWLSGKEIVYCPDWFVFHNHGRRTPEEHQKLKHNYQTGQGSFYYKQITNGHKHAQKLLYWELSADLKSWLSSWFTSPATNLTSVQLRNNIKGKWSDRYKGYKNYKSAIKAGDVQ